VILLLGGARSGKSDTAVRLAADAGAPVTFIATAEAGDAEMAERIERHRAQRPTAWTTVEAPLDLHSAVGSAPPANYIVIDCLTLWVSNLLGHGRTGHDVLAEARRVVDLLRERPAVVVSNEVGLGIVPANELARLFGDTLGSANAIFASAASRTLLMVAGRALALPSVDDALAVK
jgi:adenosylcobinamide kinase / adenosylcobinamide-phosphate guanylyltransferase